MITISTAEAYEQGVRNERERCTAMCEGLAIALQIGGQGQSAETSDHMRIAVLWLRDEIKRGPTP